MRSFRFSLSSFGGWILAVGLGLGLVACENTVEPYADQADAYSIHGYLAESRQQQFIRVKRLDAPLSGPEARTMEATVRLENQSTGQSEVLTDSIIVFEDEGAEVVTHNFWTETPIQSATPYRLTVEHPDGETTRATTTTPRSTPGVVAPDSGNCLTSFTVEFPPMERAEAVRAAVEIDYSSGVDSTGSTLRYSMTEALRDDGGSVRFEFEPEQLLGGTFESINDESEECYYTPLCLNMASNTITVRYTYLASDWSDRVSGDSVAFDPTESAFVEDGKGFFGSLWRDTIAAEVDTSGRIYTGGMGCPPRDE